ncbi:MAG TPA: hypothetical protein VHN37_03255 [Actinomycetota bacterium]|nr:hypothetical protein [Actinomycetota bacterium]
MRALRVPVVMGLLFAVLWIAGVGANAQSPYPPPTATSTEILPSFSPPPSDPPPTTDPPTPVTGSDLTRFVLIGAGLTVAGTGLVRVARRRRQA